MPSAFEPLNQKVDSINNSVMKIYSGIIFRLAAIARRRKFKKKYNRPAQGWFGVSANCDYATIHQLAVLFFSLLLSPSVGWSANCSW
jgi:hypothetical protein